MTLKLTLYTRNGCCLCEEMKTTIGEVITSINVELEEIDVDDSVELQSQYGNEVPVLFISGRKAFKYRVSAAELRKKLQACVSKEANRN